MAIIKVECDECGIVYRSNANNPVYSLKSGHFCSECYDEIFVNNVFSGQY